MTLIPFSKRYPDEFLTRSEDNFDVFLDKLKLFYNKTRMDIQDGKIARRNLNYRFNYEEELRDVKINQKGIDIGEVASEFNDMLKGCIRHQDPTTAFNIIPPSLLAAVAGITLTSLYNPNTCWDFISGKLCLYEKKITRMLGSLVGWSDANGLIVTGGKQAIAYAIKNGIDRASCNGCVNLDDYVVICSVLAHYSIEHVCHFLGVSPENCIRVPAHPSGEMDLHAFQEIIQRSISKNKKIAAVIAVGGGTINLVPDPILSIKATIDAIAQSHHLDYIPYLHVDSVITWSWLAFGDDPVQFFNQQTSSKVSKKIQHVTSKLTGIKYADSFAADFHKTGFCPYSASVFIVRDSSGLLGMAPSEYFFQENQSFGEMEPFRYTFENSRSGIPIVSIWITLRKMGLEGIREFVLYQLEVCELFKQKIQENYSDHFELLNTHSNGWEIVFKPHFRQKQSWDHLQNSSTNEQEEYINYCYAFLNDLWYRPLEDETQRYPVIGFVRKYSRNIHEKSFPAFLIHPTSPHYDENAIEEMIKSIFEAKIAFDLKQTTLATASAETYLYEMTPPR
jgi:glutamate/tyrosine decarboxylase-like PLP-dependent enzyme